MATRVPQHHKFKLKAATLLAVLIAALVLVVMPNRTREDVESIPRDDPEVMLRETTDRLLQVSTAARAYAKADPERYYAEVEQVLDQVLDMRFFARGVMATYSSPRLYESLQTDAERQEFRDRIERFVKAIKRVFMIKYSDALLVFEGERIDLARVPTGYDEPDQASVRQTIYDKGGKTYVVQYSLHRDKQGGWLVYNVIVENVNLGQIYRSQFAEAVEKHRGDVSFVVDNWVDLMLAYEETERAAKAGDGR